MNFNLRFGGNTLNDSQNNFNNFTNQSENYQTQLYVRENLGAFQNIPIIENIESTQNYNMSNNNFTQGSMLNNNFNTFNNLNNNNYSQYSQNESVSRSEFSLQGNNDYHCYSHNMSLFTQSQYSHINNEEINLKNYFSKMRDEYDTENLPTLILSQYIINTLTGELDIHNVYYVTPYGLKETKRENRDYEVKIGRMELDENDKISNDIILIDRSISRLHCKIEFQDGFKKIESMHDELVSLLMMNHQRIGRNVRVPNLDQLTLMNIYSYMTKKRQFFIKDLGSILGTYIRAKRNQYIELKRGQIFAIGSEFILIVHSLLGSENKNNNKTDLLSFLKEEKEYGACIVGNIPEEVTEELNRVVPNNENERYNSYNPPEPCLKIEINHVYHQAMSKKFILVNSDFKQNFQIGRTAVSDITINNSTISREHTQIIYNNFNKKWYITDGSTNKESLNGTWLSINSAMDRINRVESTSYPISHGDQIKIGDFLFKVEEKNIERFYNK